MQECKMPSLAELEEIWEQVKVLKEEKDNLQAENDSLKAKNKNLAQELFQAYQKIMSLGANPSLSEDNKLEYWRLAAARSMAERAEREKRNREAEREAAERRAVD